MANIGANTNLPSGSGRSYQTPEKQFGKDFGAAQYEAKPDFNESLDPVASGSDSEKFQAEVGSKMKDQSSSTAVDAVMTQAKEIFSSVGGYAKSNPKIMIGTAVAIAAIGLGILALVRREVAPARARRRG